MHVMTNVGEKMSEEEVHDAIKMTGAGEQGGRVNYVSKYNFSSFFFFFPPPTGLVRLYIAGLPLRSCRTIGAPSVQGSAHCAFFRFWQNPRQW